MRRRVVAHIPAGLADREIKLGPGGLRDVEFAVQLLQLVHGRGDETLRVGGTLPALEALRDGGYVGRDDALSLADAYRSCAPPSTGCSCVGCGARTSCPDDPAQQAWLALAMGFRPDSRGDARAVWRAEWALHAREVRRLHEKLFYRPLLDAVARVPSAALRLTPAEAGRRLAALGFADPDRALRHIEALTAGLSRRATLQRTLLPVLLSDFADAPDPDAGLLAYRRVSDELGATPWYLRLLRDEGKVATRLAYPARHQPYVARMLGRAPEALRMLADDAELAPRGRAEIATRMRDTAARREDPAAAVAAARGVRRHELLRTAFADLLGMTDLESVCDTISATTEATLDVALQVALRAVADQARAGRAAAAVRRHRDGPAGWRRRSATAPTPTSCSSSSRARTPTPTSPGSPRTWRARCARCWRHRRRPTRRSASTPTCVPRGATGRWSARWARTGSTTAAGPRPGRRRRCCGRATPPATRTSARGSSR